MESLGSKRSELRSKYLDVVDEVEILKQDLDTISRDLDRLSKGQNVELHATFDKFGKTANLQVHDAPNDEEEERKKRNTGLKIFKPPSVRQVPPPLDVNDLVLSSRGFVSKCGNGGNATHGIVY